MHPLLGSNEYRYQQHVGMPGTPIAFDILEPKSGKLLLKCGETEAGALTTTARGLLSLVAAQTHSFHFQRMTPFNLEVRTPANFKVMTLRQGVSFLNSAAQVFDERRQAAGSFVQSKRQRLNSLRCRSDDDDALVYASEYLCDVQNAAEVGVGVLQASFADRFELVDGDRKLATVNWSLSGAGAAKALFTRARDYELEIDGVVKPDDPVRLLMLAAPLWIDMNFYK